MAPRSIYDLLAEINRRVREVQRFDPAFRLRGHQRAAHALLIDLASNALDLGPHRCLAAEVVPGGGKSLLAVQFASVLIGAGMADRVLWLTPRLILNAQGRDDFVPWREPINPRHLSQARQAVFNPANLQARAINHIRELRDWDDNRARVALASYQLLLEHPEAFLAFVSDQRCLCIFDEFHMLHDAEAANWSLDQGTPWYYPVSQLLEASRSRYPEMPLRAVQMTGGFFREDNRQLPWLVYRPGDPKIGQDEALFYPQTHLQYNLHDGQVDGALIRLDFDIHNGKVVYAKNGKRFAFEIAEESPEHQGPIVQTSLFSDEVCQRVLARMVDSFVARNRGSSYKTRFLVMAKDIEAAEAHTRYLETLGQRPFLAVSRGVPNVHEKLHQFRLRRGEMASYTGLVVVDMVSIGFNFLDCSHLAYLHDNRSFAYCFQAWLRGARFDPYLGLPALEQFLSLFLLGDARTRENIRRLMSMQIPGIELVSRIDPDELAVAPLHSEPIQSSFQPLAAEITGVDFQTQDQPIVYPEWIEGMRRLHPELYKITHEQLEQLILHSRALVPPSGGHQAEPSPDNADASQPYISEQQAEESLRRDVLHPMVRELARLHERLGIRMPHANEDANPYQGIYQEIIYKFGGSIGEESPHPRLSLPDLQKVRAWLQSKLHDARAQNRQRRRTG